MISIIRSVIEEAERELLLARAKIEVAESIKRKYLEKQSNEAQDTSDIEPTEEGDQAEFGNI
jgi:hypothetical protein